MAQLDANYRIRMYEQADNQYKRWIEGIKKNAKSMTEPEWLETCSYFGGCAICGSDNIETRQFFQPFQGGGKYTVGNIFPMCGKCSVRIRKVENPFRWIHWRLGYAKDLGLNDARREKLLTYLLKKAGIEDNG